MSKTVNVSKSCPRQGLAICIPTYRRANLLKLLLEDLASQSCRPEIFIIIDGDPQSNEVRQSLDELATGTDPLTPTLPKVRYVASSHANLPYQRYLGWRVAQEENAEILLYLDDDLRVNQADALAELMTPLAYNEAGVVGCTARIVYPEEREGQYGKALADRAAHAKTGPSLLVRWFGSSRKVIPGSLSPSGHRCPPEIGSSKQTRVQWLRGGVMACRMDALNEDCFSRDLFALAEVGYGHGEDTLLSLRLGAKGKLAFVHSASFLHPCADAPKAYATHARKMGFGVAYSRRLLNDNYRWPEGPKLRDRIALLKSYLGTALLQWIRTLKAPKAHRFAYAWGYTLGAVKGILSPPRASRLTPGINWGADAERNLGGLRKMRGMSGKNESESGNVNASEMIEVN